MVTIATAVEQWSECENGCNKIVGGTSVNRRGIIPWQVSWRWGRGRSHFCGGSIIDKNWILTAAHCCEAMSKKEATKSHNGIMVVGSIDLRSNDGRDQYLEVTETIIYEGYNPRNINGDICLAYIKEDIVFNRNVQKIKIDTNFSWPTRFDFMVSGWGSRSAGGSISRYLQQVKVPHVTSNLCNNNYASTGGITDGMICAGKLGKDSCQGDSGGPMVGLNKNLEKVLVGVVSWGIGCAEEGHPGVYARVAHFADWIQRTIANYHTLQ